MKCTRYLMLIAATVAACANSNDPTPARVRQPLRVQCTDDTTDLVGASWICPEDRTVQCDSPEGTDVALIYSGPGEGQTCSDIDLVVTPQGPFELGSHSIQIHSSADGGTLLCESMLTVIDTLPPDVTPKQVELWPPNHKWHSISAADCFEVHDACDADVQATVLWVSSDEPTDDTGDGNSEPDMRFQGCDAVQLRAERQGGGDGRVYRLGWRLSDDEGNTVEKTCQVLVPHDQGHGDGSADAAALVEIQNSAACESTLDGGQ